ncbi:spermatid nuclear transition protein 3-like [Bubalus bubalis]|uniref:spermatid nuclear transition protein 3-like n=1 Tax=Bubalus bubalis TaxID=89462 RepID=UPI001E1B9EA4|nr:spermatid nuclear transition protein 3-like [Bubalus bubalis]
MEATAAKKSYNAVCFNDERTKEDPLSTEIPRPCEGTEYDHEGQKTSKCNLETENRIICHQSKKVKETRKPNCFFCSSARKKLNQSQKGY